MNKKLIYLLALVFSLGLSFTACGDDDDDPVVTSDYAKEIAGTYKGTLTVTIAGQDTPIEREIKVERTAENKATVSVIGFSFEGIGELGDIVVENIPVSKSGETINLAETKKDVTLNILGVDATVKVTVSGTVKGKVIDLKIPVAEVPVLQNLNVTFNGTKK
ncbi:hypothetical protein M2451_000273 [Dysgonomonas sp. PFB1-18]|uniref:calycin-like domain-containing protein n=1 Tax=unclassified Dysgonomonas TaxID=2630389 RepID=UPI002473C8EB|nr:MULTISPECIES: calycin-like domain-containing protein [unclassified Dysgonomonas]MDH6307824.1 hypothetical protein [Dysgonomonas sp. PF1-14]MDH6337742.1 hypothetical protein [Dysgonomonas sp. PF1-16]MDH6378966.1 hypothetical protein [Dysgonomonas sp. PFB1-18]MDH6396601.1 hypothetical protein [Dysgonomonas sp. PF1-23]